MRARTLILAALLLSACKKDKDGDGYKGDDDCDDNAAGIYPGAAEVCDGVDNNCDQTIDEGVGSTWYVDDDNDGYGNEDSPSTACTEPAGAVENGDDCDDTDQNIHPGAAETDCSDPVDYNCDGSVGYADADGDGAPACGDCDDGDDARYFGADEICDGVDNDCDEEVDDNAVGATTWYIDYDEDSYGSTAYSVEECDDPGRLFVDNSDDCNDYTADAYPGAPEFCDEIDNDCDGIIDADDPDLTDPVTLYVDEDGDGYGTDGSATVACADAAGFVGEAGDCDDADETVNPGATEVCNDGIDNDCDGGYPGCQIPLEDADTVYYGEDPGDGAGISMARAGDINADGYDDILVGADFADPDANGTGEGAGYLIYGPISSLGEIDLGDADVRFEGEADNDQAGYQVTGPGDMDGDGYPDIVVTASQHLTERSKDGALYFLSGMGVGSVNVGLGDADALYYGNSSFDFLGGGAEPGGDINADGLPDLIAGASGEDAGASQSGAMFIIYGSTSLSGTTDITTIGNRRAGEEANDRVGFWLAGPGDIDGDGFDDVVVGVKYSPANGVDSGATYVLAGPVSGDGSLSDADARIVGTSAGDWMGSDVSGAGDLNGDSYADFYIGANLEDGGGSSAGAVYMVYGGLSIGTWDGQDADTIAVVKVTGSSKDQRFGTTVDGGGDSNGDGENDLLVGSTAAGDSARGMAWLMYGPLSGSLSADEADASFEGTYNEDHAGSEVCFLGDLDGSGRDALGIAAVDANLAGNDAGAVYLILDIGL